MFRTFFKAAVFVLNCVVKNCCLPFSSLQCPHRFRGIVFQTKAGAAESVRPCMRRKRADGNRNVEVLQAVSQGYVSQTMVVGQRAHEVAREIALELKSAWQRHVTGRYLGIGNAHTSNGPKTSLTALSNSCEYCEQSYVRYFGKR